MWSCNGQVGKVLQMDMSTHASLPTLHAKLASGRPARSLNVARPSAARLLEVASVAELLLTFFLATSVATSTRPYQMQGGVKRAAPFSSLPTRLL